MVPAGVAARVSGLDARAAGRVLVEVGRSVSGVSSVAVRWWWRHRRLVAALTLLALLLHVAGHGTASTFCAARRRSRRVWCAGCGRGGGRSSFERCWAGPSRRRGWRRWATRNWETLARECGLSVQRSNRARTWAVAPRHGRAMVSQSSTVQTWVHPRLVDVTTDGVVLALTIRTRVGQTVEDLEKAAPALAAAAGAISVRCRVLTPSTVLLSLVMREHLADPRTAAAADIRGGGPGRASVGGRTAPPGRCTVTGRHTLVVGCSGSGKGSIFWGVCAGLAPAVRAGVVRLWGLDLKRGVEVGMGAPCSPPSRPPPTDAVAVMAPAAGRAGGARAADGRTDPAARPDHRATRCTCWRSTSSRC